MTAGTIINLTNPTSGAWDSFVRDNARQAGASAWLAWRDAQKVSRIPKPEPRKPQMAGPNSAVGRTLILCGAGPSLREHWHDWLGPEGRGRMPKTDVWAANSAATWLHAQGAYLTHAFGIDQTEGLLAEWADPPPVTYVVATTVNPATIKHLLAHGRRLLWFHNFVGSTREASQYKTLWPSGVMVGDGLNAINRALCLAKHMAYAHIVVLGADCALGPNDEMHANGDGPTAHGATPVIMGTPPGALIDGRTWRSKPDMLFSARALAEMADRSMGRIELIGDTLPNALLAERANHPNWTAFLDRVAKLPPIPGGQGFSGQPSKPQGRNMTSEIFAMETLGGA